ncbi:MAG: hypothetical protein ABW223_10985 [Rariglobus sp.]
MIVNYWILPIALLLLWLPRQWLRFGGKVIKVAQPRRRDRGDGLTRDESVKAREEFSKPRNWVDLLRAAAGSVAVGYACFEPGPDAARSVGTQIFVVEALILIIAVLIQTVRIEGKLSLTAPIFFLLGLSFGVIGWKAALFACVAIWIVNLVLPGSGIFLFVFAGLEICFGILLSRLPVRDAVLAALLTILPVIFSAALKRRLVRLSRKTRSVRV